MKQFELQYLGGKSQELPTLRSLAIDLLNENISEKQELEHYLTVINDPDNIKQDLYNIISELEGQQEEQPQLEYYNARFN